MGHNVYITTGESTKSEEVRIKRNDTVFLPGMVFGGITERIINSLLKTVGVKRGERDEGGNIGC